MVRLLCCGGAAALAAFIGMQKQRPDVSPQERQILLEFYAATGGASWTTHDGWGTTTPVCDWYGVMCDERNRASFVVWIDLRDNNLRGTIPPTLASLQYLRALDVSGNHLSGAVPERFLNLWDAHQFEFSGWGNTFSSSIVRASVSVSGGGVLCDMDDDVRYQFDIDAVARRAKFQSVRCASADPKSRKTYCLVREGTAPEFDRLSRALETLKFRTADAQYDYPFTAATHGEFLTTTIVWGDGSKQTVETYDRQGPLDVWIAQQTLLGAMREVGWRKESRTAACTFEKGAGS